MDLEAARWSEHFDLPLEVVDEFTRGMDTLGLGVKQRNRIWEQVIATQEHYPQISVAGIIMGVLQAAREGKKRVEFAQVPSPEQRQEIAFLQETGRITIEWD